MGKAIVTSDVGDVPRFIEDNKNGFIVPCRDSQALADRVDRLIKAPELRKKFGRRARQTAEQFLDISVIGKNQINAYHKTID